ncbi:MAG: carboxypeptidase-like regulatory domain-containing protein, partial [Syntrophothermus sp.]
MTIPGKNFASLFKYAALPLMLLMFLNSSAIRAQSKGILRGLVTDSSSSEALAFASVFIEELKTGALTDSKGYFIITSIPADKQFTLSVSYTGYFPKKISFSVTSSRMAHIDIRLSSSSIYLPAVEKIEKRFTSENSTDISLQRLNIRDLELLPKGVETDIIRSLHYLPGVRSTGDVSARYYIRGGASNQNLVQINGAAIYNPFHALGLFSVVDPEIVNSAEFYKGGFPAEYSGRLSSVLNLSIKDGNKNSFS